MDVSLARTRRYCSKIMVTGICLWSGFERYIIKVVFCLYAVFGWFAFDMEYFVNV